MCFKKLFLKTYKHQVNEAKMSKLLKQSVEIVGRRLRKVSMLK